MKSKKRTKTMSVFMDHADWAKIQEYIDLCPVEIAGVAEVRDEGTHLVVHNPVILKQEGSGHEVDLDPEELLKWMTEKGLITGEALPYVNFCFWHSHVDMGVTFSNTDDIWIGDYVNRGWLVSIVGNKKGAHTTRVDTLVGATTEEKCMHVTLPGDLRLLYPGTNVKAECATAYKELFTQKSYAPWKGHGRGKDGKFLPAARYNYGGHDKPGCMADYLRGKGNNGETKVIHFNKDGTKTTSMSKRERKLRKQAQQIQKQKMQGRPLGLIGLLETDAERTVLSKLINGPYMATAYFLQVGRVKLAFHRANEGKPTAITVLALTEVVMDIIKAKFKTTTDVIAKMDGTGCVMISELAGGIRIQIPKELGEGYETIPVN